MKKVLSAITLILVGIAAIAQSPSPFDFGKMWTFENPPTEWFQEAYGMDVDQAWFDNVRESSLRFATWCSASFVSPNGLIMTNHHCSQSEIYPLQKDGEDFDKNGFVAAGMEDERKAEGLFVEQLIKVDDITDRVKSMLGATENEADRQAQIGQALIDIENEYAGKEEWDGLRLQVVTYYSGGKFSIYGYKRYDDIRLVFIPEENLGFYGGDPDNFTYPRYNLDCTFWRAYDENGQPVDSRDNYFKFNPDGVEEGTPVFIVGNPGSTERYRTVSQLEYDRDFRYPTQIKWMQDRYELMEMMYEKDPNDDLKSTMFSYSNSLKATRGILEGLEDPELFARKVAMEKLVRSKAGDVDYWDQLTDYYDELGPKVAELQVLQPNPDNQGYIIALLPAFYQYQRIAEENPDDAGLEQMRTEIVGAVKEIDWEQEKAVLTVVLNELQELASSDDTYLDELMGDMSTEEYVAKIMDKSVLTDPDKLDKMLSKPKKAAKGKDDIFSMAEILFPQYMEAAETFRGTSAERNALEEKVANETFKVFGDDLPPDATFTLRISDGVVKRYEYNGTTAPYKTTFFGLYDRHYSNNQEFPWALPEKWANPPMELLMSPMNFVSTNDIIGGNSGSPVINQDGEAVGLVFDGNIESLPGNFIFDEEYNRSVSVHAGGIIAAMRHIYKADRLADELLGE